MTFDNLDTLTLFSFIYILRTQVVIVVSPKVSTQYPRSFSDVSYWELVNTMPFDSFLEQHLVLK